MLPLDVRIIVDSMELNYSTSENATSLYSQAVCTLSRPLCSSGPGDRFTSTGQHDAPQRPLRCEASTGSDDHCAARRYTRCLQDPWGLQLADCLEQVCAEWWWSCLRTAPLFSGAMPSATWLPFRQVAAAPSCF
jgi:hypothetical protein